MVRKHITGLLPTDNQASQKTDQQFKIVKMTYKKGIMLDCLTLQVLLLPSY